MMLVALMQNICMCLSRIIEPVSNGKEGRSRGHRSGRKPSKALHYIKSHPILLLTPKEVCALSGSATIVYVGVGL